jgi:hypothetical protein
MKGATSPQPTHDPTGEIAPVHLTSNEREAANRAEATALLIRTGFRVYRPEADSYGEDLVVRSPRGGLHVVQLKARPTVDAKRYGGDLSIWMLFPDPAGSIPGRDWFLVPHSDLYHWVKTKHGNAPGWNDAWSYPGLSQALRLYLEPYSHRNWTRAMPMDANPGTP